MPLLLESIPVTDAAVPSCPRLFDSNTILPSSRTARRRDARRAAALCSQTHTPWSPISQSALEHEGVAGQSDLAVP